MPPDRGLCVPAATGRILIQTRALLVLFILRTAGEYAIEISQMFIWYNPSDRVLPFVVVYVPPDMRDPNTTRPWLRVAYAGLRINRYVRD